MYFSHYSFSVNFFPVCPAICITRFVVVFVIKDQVTFQAIGISLPSLHFQDNKIVIEKETAEDWEEDSLTKEEYKGVVQETMEDVQDYLFSRYAA